jgi:hypothetical protein
MAVDSSSFQPSRIGFGSIRGAPRPAGRISNMTCGAVFFDTRPMRPSTVPDVTRAPRLSGFMSTSERSSPNTRLR